MSGWTGQLILFAWALSCVLVAVAGWFAGWAGGFIRGVRWERSKQQAWLGRERRKEWRPVEVERRAVRPAVPPTEAIPLRQPAASAQPEPAPGEPPDTAKAPTPEGEGLQADRVE